MRFGNREGGQSLNGLADAPVPCLISSPSHVERGCCGCPSIVVMAAMAPPDHAAMPVGSVSSHDSAMVLGPWTMVSVDLMVNASIDMPAPMNPHTPRPNFEGLGKYCSRKERTRSSDSNGSKPDLWHIRTPCGDADA